MADAKCPECSGQNFWFRTVVDRTAYMDDLGHGKATDDERAATHIRIVYCSGCGHIIGVVKE